MQEGVNPAHIISTAYAPVAIYYEGADCLEYVRADVTGLYDRVDSLLTLIYDMDQEDRLVGFQLKGFRGFLTECGIHLASEEFRSLVGLIEAVMTKLGSSVVDRMRKTAYERAWKLALEDGVELHDLPNAAYA